MAELTSQMDDLRSTMTQELEDIKKRSEELQEEKNLFETERQRISHLIDETDQVLKNHIFLFSHFVFFTFLYFNIFVFLHF